MIKSLRTKTILLAACLSLLLPATLCSAGEYLISDQELTRQEQNLAQLEQNLIQQTDSYQKANQLLTNSNAQIVILQTRLQKVEQLLIRSDKQIVILQAKLTEAQSSISLTSTSLEIANKDLKEYEKQVKGEIRKLSWQRNVAILGIVAMAFRK